MRQVMPMNRLMTIRKMYAVLGSSKIKDAGYIMGVMDHLHESGIRYQKDLIHTTVHRQTGESRTFDTTVHECEEHARCARVRVQGRS